MFQSRLRTSRLGGAHNKSTARFRQGLAACLVKSKLKSCLHRNPNRKACPPLALLPPLCQVLQTLHWLVLLSSKRCRTHRTGTWEGMEGIRPTAPPNMLRLPRDWRPRRAGGPLPSPEEPDACAHGPAIPHSLKTARSCMREVECSWHPALVPVVLAKVLLVLGCVVHETHGTEMNLLPSPTTGPGCAVRAGPVQEVVQVSDPALQRYTSSLWALLHRTWSHLLVHQSVSRR